MTIWFLPVPLLAWLLCRGCCYPLPFVVFAAARGSL
jgi:hypothetical protein